MVSYLRIFSAKRLHVPLSVLSDVPTQILFYCPSIVLWLLTMKLLYSFTQFCWFFLTFTSKYSSCYVSSNTLNNPCYLNVRYKPHN